MGSLAAIARHILREPCCLTLSGDSRIGDLGSDQFCTTWHRSFQPYRWSGWGGSGLDNGLSITGGIFNLARIGGWAQAGWTTNPSGGAGDVNLWPCPFGDYAFGSDLAANGLLVLPYSDNTFMAQFKDGDWQQSAVTWRAIFYRSTGSVLGIDKIQTQTRRIPTTGEPPGHLTASNSLANGYNYIDTALDAAAERGDLLINGANPNIVETGKNLYFCGWRVWRDRLGLQINMAGTGGATAADHAGTTKVSSAGIAAMVAGYDTDTVLFFDGHNNGTIDATWRDNYVTWINRWRSAVTAAGRTFRGVVVSDYQTVTNTAARVAAMESYLQPVCAAASDLGFIPLGSLDNGYAKNNSLLADGTHTNPAGSLYMTGRIYTALATASDGGWRSRDRDWRGR